MAEGRIIIDGSMGEGGGQILRTSVGLAAALGVDVEIHSIRAKRPKPGMHAQHLMAVRAAAKICQGELTGDQIGSTHLTFTPGPLTGGRHEFDIGTAGSTTLVLQTVLPGLLVCDEDAEVIVRGGTHNPMAPCFEYLRDVFGVLASAMNMQVHFQMERPGFFPAGGGRLKMVIGGVQTLDDLSPIRYMTRGQLRRIEILSAAARALPEHIVQRQAHQAMARLESVRQDGRLPVEVELLADRQQWDTLSPGTVVFARAVFSRSAAGFFALGRLGVPAERIADEAVDQLLEFLEGGGAVDAHAGDQLLTLAALCPAASRFSVQAATSHLQTNADVVRLITGRAVEIAPADDGSVVVNVGPMD